MGGPKLAQNAQQRIAITTLATDMRQNKRKRRTRTEAS